MSQVIACTIAARARQENVWRLGRLESHLVRTSSAKEGLGTAYSGSCRLWFTLSHGIINEIYYPTVDQPNTRDFEFLISDGKTDPDVLALDFFLILQRGAGDHGTGEENRFKFGKRRQYACAANLDSNPFQFGFSLLVRRFGGDRLPPPLPHGAPPSPFFSSPSL